MKGKKKVTWGNRARKAKAPDPFGRKGAKREKKTTNWEKKTTSPATLRCSQKGGDNKEGQERTYEKWGLGCLGLVKHDLTARQC